MKWKLRHEGSPRHLDNLSFEQIVQGLRDAEVETTDEVMGPGEKTWLAIETHPRFVEIVDELDPGLPTFHDDETRLDMNALIDVCLVLLVFFILTTTYAVLQKRIEAPPITRDQKGVRVITDKQVVNQMIRVDVKMQDGEPVILVEDVEVEADTEKLIAAIRGWVNQKALNQLLLAYDPKVPHGTVVQIQDAAKGAGMDRIQIVVP